MPKLSAEDIQGWSRDRLQDEYGERLDRVRSIREEAGGSLTKVVDGQADEVRNLMADTNLLGERLDETAAQSRLEEEFAQQAARKIDPRIIPGEPRFGPDSIAAPSREPRDIGGRFLASDAWKVFRAEGSTGLTASLPLAAVWAGYRGIGETPVIEAATFDTTDYPSVEDFRPAPIETLYQQNNIGPLMAQGTTDARTIRYPLETVTATGAAAVAEAGTKPEAGITFTPVDEPIRKIAVLLPITDEALEDESFLRAYINARLRLFVMNEEDRQLLAGDDTATPPQIEGLLNRTGIDASTSYSLAGDNPDQALIDGVFKAAMRVREAFLMPDAFVVRAATWEIARLAKDANRQYLLGPPGGDAPTRLWGLRGVINENMPAVGATNEPALVGAFRTAAMLVRRSGIDLAMSDSHDTFFAENKVMLRAEERAGMPVFRPAGFATVTSAA